MCCSRKFEYSVGHYSTRSGRLSQGDFGKVNVSFSFEMPAKTLKRHILSMPAEVTFPESVVSKWSGFQGIQAGDQGRRDKNSSTPAL
jgi:hypothetical protein